MNNQFLEELFYLLTLPFLSGIIHYFFSRCLSCRIEKKSILFLYYVLYFICSAALHFSPWSSPVLMAVNVGLIMWLTSLYKGGVIWKSSAAFFIVALIILSDAAMPMAYSSTGYILNLFLSKALMLLLVLIFVRVAKSYGKGSLSIWYWLMLFSCPFFSMIGVTHLLSNLLLQSHPELFSLLSIGLLVINFLIFMLSDRVLYIQSEQDKCLMLEQQNTYYINQYLMSKKMQEEAVRFQHDFKNILWGMRAKLYTDPGERQTEELDELLGKIETQTGFLDSGNVVIDSIINYKQQIAAKHNVPFELNINIPPYLDLDTTSISIILGNTLDNAIEACTEKLNTSRCVHIHMHYFNESLFMRIQNPYINKIKKNRDGELCTTKSDKSSHGIGLQNVRRTVETANGLLDISYDEGIFSIEIVLFNVHREDKSPIDLTSKDGRKLNDSIQKTSAQPR